MRRILITILITILCGLGNLAANGQTDPEEVVANLYKTEKFKYIGDMSESELQKYFDDDLIKLILKANKDENGLNFSVLYYAQDTKIKNFKITEIPTDSPVMWEVIVSFTNFNEKEKFTFQVIRLDRGWRIAEIYYTDGTTLTGILDSD